MDIEKSSKIFVAGHKGLVGSAIVRELKRQGFRNIIERDRAQVDLLSQQQTFDFLGDEKVDCVFLAAAKVGGIVANRDFQADFLWENLTIAANTIHAAHKANVKKLIFLGSSCIYPKFACQPIQEKDLLTGPLEITNEGYAIAKIAGLKLCQMFRRQYSKDFISAMPTNLYGIKDNFHPEYSHVIPGLIRRFHEAKIDNKGEVKVWGSGKPMREFLYADDLAEALIFLMNNYSGEETINVGTGCDITISNLAYEIADVVEYKGDIIFDSTKPDGTPRKVLNVDKINSLGWKAKTPLKQGLKRSYDWAVENIF